MTKGDGLEHRRPSMASQGGTQRNHRTDLHNRVAAFVQVHTGCLLCEMTEELNMKSEFGVDPIECPKCGLAFNLVGDGLSGDLRSLDNQNPQRCRRSSRPTTSCPELTETVEQVVRARLQRANQWG